MRSRIAATLVGIAMLILISMVTGTARQRETWEYYVHTTDAVGTLNKWGQDGWEVAAAVSSGDGVRVIMKRRKG